MSIKGTRSLTGVDDSEPALALRTLILQTKGYAVTTFNSALQAAQKFESGKFDLAWRARRGSAGVIVKRG